MTSSQLTYLRLKTPFGDALRSTREPSISETNSAGAFAKDSAVTVQDGITDTYAKSESNSGKLVPRRVFNILMNYVTKVHYLLQCGFLYQCRIRKSGNTGSTLYPRLAVLDEDADLNRKDVPNSANDHDNDGEYPDNAVLPYVDDTALVAYYRHKLSEKKWIPFDSLRIFPDNTIFKSYDNKKARYVAAENCWMYIRAICIPSFAVKVNGQTVAILTQNSNGTRTHGAVAHSTTLLLRKGDVVTFPALAGDEERKHIYYVVTPCVNA